jgi:3-dehydroquinate synthetase
VAAQKEDRDLGAGGPPNNLVAIVNEDLGYPIAIGNDLSEAVAGFAGHRASRVVILCDADPHVASVARAIAGHLRADAGAVLPFALGESRKRLPTVEHVLEELLAVGAQRDTLVVGVGGGVAADLFGFAAASYMRGVAYVHVATTLTAMADAAIGGKTGVNLARAKNLAGALRDPIAVFCQVDALQTLPFAILREGLAEIVKAGVIEGEALFDALEELAPDPFSQWPWAALIAAAIKVKTAIVAQDRLETGARETLNLGHTFAHGIEAASGYRITHGAAVALGLRAAGLLALHTGRFSEREHLRVLALLALLGMPLRTTADPDAVLAAMRGDKKRRGERLRFVLPRAIGEVECGVECPERVVGDVLVRLTRAPSEVRR